METTVYLYNIVLCTSGEAWHTPVRTCVRLKIEIPKLDKAKKLKMQFRFSSNGG